MLQTLYQIDPSQPALHAALLLTLALLCVCVRRFRFALILATLGVGWVALCATPAFANFLRSGLENPYPARPADTYPVADAIVVLGGGDPPDFGHGEGKEQSTRAGFALELYRVLRAPVVLTSGGDGEATEMAQQLQQQGVPARSLRIEPDSITTYQNATYSAILLKRESIHRILLVTSAVPMRRAVACFEHQGFEVTAAPAFDAIQQQAKNAPWQPRTDMLYKTQRYLHEYIGMLVYTLCGWV